MKLSEIQTTLRELNAPPTKSLGQNFLHDKNLAAWIVSQARIGPEDRWLEIGPGLGALTDIALQHSSRGTLLEKDDRLIPFLRDRYPQLRVIHADAARFDVRELLPQGPLRVFGNLPYYVSSQILFNFTPPHAPVTRMVFTLQKELAERMAAPSGTRQFGAPSALIGRRWRVTILKDMPPSVFMPVPKVDSSVVCLEPREPGEFSACDDARFSELVKRGFSQRRKQLGNLLSGLLPDWPAAAARIGVPVSARAESLTIENWCALASGEDSAQSDGCVNHAQDVHGERFDVVDENDCVTGSDSRFEVHRKNLRHRAVHILVFNRAGEVFLQRRSRWKDRHPMTWDSSAAGHVNAGDDYESTAPRELEEELGIRGELRFVSKINACSATGEEFVHLYSVAHEGPFRLPPAEIDCGMWFSPELLDAWLRERPEDFAPGFVICWKRWREIWLTRA